MTKYLKTYENLKTLTDHANTLNRNTPRIDALRTLRYPDYILY